MTTGMVLDLLLAGLLVATIGYAALLNKRLDVLREGKEELRGLINDFTAATQQARGGMEELSKASEGSGRVLREIVDDAQSLREDLGFLIERGTVVADQLGDGVRQRRVVPIGAPGEKAKAAGKSAPPASEDQLVNLRKILEATR